MKLGPMNYAGGAPTGYRCTTCGAHGCKLWREYQTFADRTELVCCECAGKSQGKDVSLIDTEGRRPLDDDSSIRTDQIGWRVPAVPSEEGDSFWGYSSVPDAGARWWRALPTRPIRADRPLARGGA